jgi:hypothetical protein
MSRLPPEIRAQIYAATLTQYHPLLITRKHFTPRTHPNGLFPNRCMHCLMSPLPRCICHLSPPSIEFYYHPFLAPSHTISATILGTCRLIYAEAAPLLYCENTFHFVDPGAIKLFHECVDQRHVQLIEKIMLTMHSRKRNSLYQWENYVSAPHGKLHLGSRFPNFKSISIRLRGQFELCPVPKLGLLCYGIARHMPPLEWIHIDGLTSLDGVPAFHPVVSKAGSSAVDQLPAESVTEEIAHVPKGVQVAEHALWAREGWKNVTLWWGNEGEKAPYPPPEDTTRINVRQILQTESRGFRASEELVPCAGGVGGTKGAFSFL